MNTNFPVTPCLTGTDPEQMRLRLRDYFHQTYDEYESLFDTLACEEAYYQKPIALRHPLIFYFGHTATFFINKLLLVGLIEQRLDPRLESMFAIGVDEMSWDDLDEQHYEWPTVAEVRKYRLRVRQLVDSLIKQAPLTLPIDWDNPFWAIMMGIEHERIHLETSSVLIRQQQLSLVKDSVDWPVCEISSSAPDNYWVTVPAGSVSLGKSFADDYYGWDNEYGRHQADVPAFQASAYLVSNGEYLNFVNAGGYQQDRYWQEEGLAWRNYTGCQHPEFWVATDDGWALRVMTRQIPMPWDWPVEVNYHEAKAFCHWRSEQTGQTVRMPSEDEWHRMLEHSGYQHVLAEDASDANLQLRHWASSCPVNHFRHGDFYDVMGNVWQWTETPTYPFTGFSVHPIYDDFTTPTFDERHNLIKGGAWVSAGNEALPWSRYAFRRHFFQHAGFRYVLGQALPQRQQSHYETDQMLSQYLEFHYGERYFDVANFPQALAQLARRLVAGNKVERALDLGCSVGRASFELADFCDEVTGVDFSARFINLANQLKEQGLVRYTRVDEGELVDYCEHSLAEFGLEHARHKVTFYQGDACNLKSVFSGYDLVLAANLLDRLYDPGKFLNSIHQRINANGLLILASPYTWLEEYTKRSEWIGGFKKDGERYTTLDGLKAHLGEHFRLVEAPQALPFVIRETRHKYQHSLSEVTIWQRM